MTVEEICKLASNGNPQAEVFCLSWVRFCHTIDNAIDDSRKITDVILVSCLVDWMEQLIFNQFFLSFRAVLFGLIIQSACAWLSSNQRCMTNEQNSVLKGMYHEVVFHVAFLTGGWASLLEATKKCREYKLD